MPDESENLEKRLDDLIAVVRNLHERIEDLETMMHQIVRVPPPPPPPPPAGSARAPRPKTQFTRDSNR